MFRKLFATLILTGFVGRSVILADDPSQHKGTPTTGQVLSIADDRIELKTGKGLKVVALNDKTTFERGKVKASLSAFKKGDRVAVLGTTLASGEILAEEVLLDTSASTRFWRRGWMCGGRGMHSSRTPTGTGVEDPESRAGKQQDAGQGRENSSHQH